MKFKNFKAIWVLIGLLSMTTLACGLSEIGNDGPPSNATVVNMVANTSLEPWLNTAVSEFNATKTETSDGNPVYVQLQA